MLQHETMASWSADIDDKRKAWQVPGCAMAVIQGTDVIFCESFGHLQKGAVERVSPQTLFPIASATKPFTAHGLAMLAEDGLLDFDTPIQTYWPEFRLYDAVATNRTTVRDLLCHRTGLPRHDLVWYHTPLSRAELMERLRYLEPVRDFRAAYHYQNLMFTAAGIVIEQVSGRTWEQFTKERILKPLGMESTYFTLADAKKAGALARPYMSQGKQVVEVPYLNNETIGPAGSMISTIEDMTKWLLYQLNPQAITHANLLSERRHDELRKPQLFSGSQPAWCPEIPITNAALGWFVQIYRGERVIYHAGNLQGFSSLVSFLPERKCAIVVLSQVDNSRLPAVLTYEAVDRLLGIEQIDWHARMTEEAEKEESAKLAKSSRSECKQGSVLRSSCMGTYRHPGYGEVSIYAADDNYYMSFHDLRFLLSPIEANRFLASYEETYQLAIPITFHTDHTGTAISLSAKMEPAIGAKEIIFTRV